MPRRVRDTAPRFAELEAQPARSTTINVPDALTRLKFPLSLALPGYHSCTWRDDDGETAALGLWTDDGSTATATTNGAVRQIGPRELWTEVERLAAVFNGTGAPERQHFGITVKPSGQTVWYQDESGPSWPLPTE